MMEKLKIKENKILELTGENKILKSRLISVKKDLKELQEKYNELKKRYAKQNNELCQAKINLSREGYYDNSRSK